MRKPLRKLPPPSEEDVQKVVADYFRAVGFLVLVTTRRWKKCHRCGAPQKKGRGDGVSKGLADLLIRREHWPQGMWISIEIKKPGLIRWSSREQELHYQARSFWVCQSLERAKEIVRHLDGEEKP